MEGPVTDDTVQQRARVTRNEIRALARDLSIAPHVRTAFALVAMFAGDEELASLSRRLSGYAPIKGGRHGVD